MSREKMFAHWESLYGQTWMYNQNMPWHKDHWPTEENPRPEITFTIIGVALVQVNRTNQRIARWTPTNQRKSLCWEAWFGH